MYDLGVEVRAYLPACLRHTDQIKTHDTSKAVWVELDEEAEIAAKKASSQMQEQVKPNYQPFVVCNWWQVKDSEALFAFAPLVWSSYTKSFYKVSLKNPITFINYL